METNSLKALSMQCLQRNRQGNQKEKQSFLAGKTDSIIGNYRKLLDYISENDPSGGCWEWLKENHPALWNSHKFFFQSGNFTEAKLTFNVLIQVFQSNNEGKAK